MHWIFTPDTQLRVCHIFSEEGEDDDYDEEKDEKREKKKRKAEEKKEERRKSKKTDMKLAYNMRICARCRFAFL